MALAVGESNRHPRFDAPTSEEMGTQTYATTQSNANAPLSGTDGRENKADEEVDQKRDKDINEFQDDGFKTHFRFLM